MTGVTIPPPTLYVSEKKVPDIILLIVILKFRQVSMRVWLFSGTLPEKFGKAFKPESSMGFREEKKLT